MGYTNSRYQGVLLQVSYKPETIASIDGYQSTDVGTQSEKKKKKSLNFMVKATLISREIRQMVAAGASP